MLMDVKMNTSEDAFSIISSSMDFLVAKKQHSYKASLVQIQQEVFSVHQEAEILYIVRGTIKLQTKLGERVLNQGDHCLIKQRAAHKVIPVSEDNIVFVFQMDDEQIKDIGYKDVCAHKIRVDSKDTHKVLFEKIAELYLWQIRGNGKDINIDQNVHMVGHCVNKLLKRRASSSIEGNDESIQTVVFDVAETYIRQSDFEKTLEEVAVEYKLSYSYLSRMFREVTGLSFTRFVTRVKLSLAAEKILSTEDPIVEIAYQCGYKESRTMNRDFKLFLNIAPLSLRNKYKKLHLDADECCLQTIPEVKPFIKEIEKKGFLKSESFMKRRNHTIHTEKPIGIMQMKWGVVADFESCMMDREIDFNESMIKCVKTLSKELSTQFIRFKLKYSDEKFYVSLANDEKTLFDEENIKTLMILAGQLSVTPIFSIDFGVNYDQCEQPPIGDKERYLDLLGKFDLLFKRITKTQLRQCRFELNLEGFNSIFSEDYLETMDQAIQCFVELIKGKVCQDIQYRGLHIGEYVISNQRLRGRCLKVLKYKLKQFDFFSARFIYQEKSPDIMSDPEGIQEQYTAAEEKISKLLPKTSNSDNPHLIVDLTYEFQKNLKKHTKTMMGYHILLETALSKTCKAASVVSLFQIRWTENGHKKWRDFGRIDKAFRRPLYYLLNLYQFLADSEILVEEEGCVISQKKDSIFGFFYLGQKGRWEATGLQSIPKSRQYQIVIPKSMKKYKVSEYTFNESVCSENQDYTSFTGEGFLKEEEYHYIQKTMMPELAIECKEYEDETFHTVNVQPHDICIVRIDKMD